MNESAKLPAHMLPPLLFHPIAKARAWAPIPSESHLFRWQKPLIHGARVGETWEVADLPDSILDGQSRVRGGAFDGRTLRDIRTHHRDELLGIATPAADGAFPILVKFLEAADNLSLQVHPDEAYARAHPESHLKTEAWIIIEAKPGARVYRGIRDSTSAAEFEAALVAGRALDHVESFNVARGDCVYLPSGTCHALGGGILAAEVQTPSDTTFRVWDWNRADPARPLHSEAARACMKFGAEQHDGCAGMVRFADAPIMDVGGVITRRLCRSKFFTIEWIDTTAEVAIPLYDSGVPEVWMTLAGSSAWTTASGSFNTEVGDTVLRPGRVEAGAVRLMRGSSILRFICASPLDSAS